MQRRDIRLSELQFRGVYGLTTATRAGRLLRATAARAAFRSLAAPQADTAAQRWPRPPATLAGSRTVRILMFFCQE